MSDLEPILAWTDGACSGNPGPGGWAFAMTLAGKCLGRAGGNPYTTNNRMELLAVLSCIEAIPSRHAERPAIIHSDSGYVVDAVAQYLAKWQANGWRTSTKTAVKNQDLWERYVGLAMRPGKLSLVKVQGHSGKADGNAFVDARAKAARDKAGTVSEPFAYSIRRELLEAFLQRSEAA